MPRQLSRQVLSSLDVSRHSRRIRRPQHPFFVKVKPWQLQPICIAPVLPGETMRNLLLQARVLTDPIKHALTGWHAEFYFFYCKHRDLDDRDIYTAMMLDVSATPPVDNTAEPKLYYRGGKHNWLRACLERIVAEYFRNEGEDEPTDIDGLPPVAVNDMSWLDSAVLTDRLTAVDVTVDGTPPLLTSEIDEAMRQWELLRLQGLTQMSYEDYLAAYGVRPPLTELHRPELIRYVRQWTYPASTVEPTDGSANSVCSWAIAERADKDRFFTEPGFIIGLFCVRPKVYRGNQVGTAVSSMVDALAWLPGILDRNDPRLGLRPEPNNAAGPTNVTDSDGYTWDVRDLMLYGDQFLNFDPDDGEAPTIALPTAILEKRYPTEADADALFVYQGDPEAEPDPIPPRTFVKADGIVSISIASSTKDVSPTTYETV